MGEALIIYVGMLVLLFMMGMPVAFALGATAIVASAYQFGFSIPFDMFAQRMVSGINNFTILAVPFFIFAARVMNTGGVTRRLFGFADVCVGHLKGGLGHTNILASMLFAGMSGAAVSDAAGLGLIEIEAMRDAGYDEDFSAAVTAASSTIGPIIPPSIPMVFYAVQGGVSVGALFMGGLVPGVLMGLSMMVLVFYYAKSKCPAPRKAPSFREILYSLGSAIIPLMCPIIIIGGIYTGWFTPTEAAVIAAVYAVLVGVIFYKEINLKTLHEIIRLTIRDTVAMGIIVACTYPYAWLITTSGIPQQFSAWVLSVTQNPIIVLLLINIFLLIVGCFMEGCSAIMLLAPIMLPLVTALGIHPVHFGIIMVVNLMIGCITPPFGIVLFVTARVAKRPLSNVIKSTMPFVVPLLIVLLIITYAPEIVLWLPRITGMI